MPCVLLAAVFFVSQGIAVPTLYDQQEARLSSPQKAKPLVNLAAKSKLSSLTSRIVKATQLFDCSRTGLLWNPDVLDSVPHHVTRYIISVSASALSARAPPA